MRLSIEELKGYCGLVRHENSCRNAAEASDAMISRFGWPTATRSKDIETAWKLLIGDIKTNENREEDVRKESPVKESKHADETSNDVPKESKNKESNTDNTSKKEQKNSAEPVINSSTVPVVLKPNAWDRKVLICEVDDPDFNIQGDSGAVGRISVDATSLSVDVKGRQYRGIIRPGPTIMLLNLAPPVGIQPTGPSYKETARVEVLTNEYCNLEFERDLLGTIMGRFEGDNSIRDDESEDYSTSKGGNSFSKNSNKKNNNTSSSSGGGGSNTAGKKKRKSSGSDDNDSEDDLFGENLNVSSKGGAPKISTITQRKRMSGGTKKKNTKKKITKTKK